MKQLDLLDLAAIGANDPEYQQMIRHLERGIQEDLLEEDSELRKLVGNLPHLGLQTLSRGKLIVKNGNNILIPKEARACILKELHSTHLSTEMMKNIFRGIFIWSKMNEDVERIYHECEGCQREAASKVKKKCEVILPNFPQVAPAESISIDYAVNNRQ